MALPSPIELIIADVEKNLQSHLQSHMDEGFIHQFKSMDVRKKFFRFGYDPKFIDRDIFPYVGLNGSCEKYHCSVDSVTKDLLGEYSIKLQENMEREWFDKNFDRKKQDLKINKIQSTTYKAASIIAGVLTFAGGAYVGTITFNPQFSETAILLGFFSGGFGYLVESMINPLGNLLMNACPKSILLGTNFYRLELKETYTKKIIKHIKKIDSADQVLRYSDDMYKISRN